MKEPIARFRGEYKFLSNFWTESFVFEGDGYRSVEHAYQCRKTTDRERSQYIAAAETCQESANRGRDRSDTKLRHDWDRVKGDLMEHLVRAKFKQSRNLQKELLATGDRYLMEGNYWHDNYFGVCCCRKCHQEVDSPKNMLVCIGYHIDSKSARY